MLSERIRVVKDGFVISNWTGDFLLDATVVRETPDKSIREENARRIVEIISETGVLNRTPEGNPPLEVAMGMARRGYGIFGMSARLWRPNSPDVELSRNATGSMRSMTNALGGFIDKDFPAASFSTQSGITLETNPAASSSMDTDGQSYKGSQPIIELYAHNLYTHEAQLICLAGLIALAGGDARTPTKP